MAKNIMWCSLAAASLALLIYGAKFRHPDIYKDLDKSFLYSGKIDESLFSQYDCLCLIGRENVGFEYLPNMVRATCGELLSNLNERAVVLGVAEREGGICNEIGLVGRDLSAIDLQVEYPMEYECRKVSEEFSIVVRDDLYEHSFASIVFSSDQSSSKGDMR